MPAELFTDFRSGERYKVEYDNRIGGGQQGEVFEVQRIDNRPRTDYLIKIYNDVSDAIKRHAKQFVAHLDSCKLQTEGLAGLPTRCVESNSTGRIAVFMARVPGRTLDTVDIYQWLKKQSLSVRIEIARQVAHSLSRFHNAGIVHADIAEPNMMLDENTLTTYLIDADGGGILDNQRQYRLKPVVHGHPTASWNAPELYRPDGVPSIDSDNWSLAVIILKILTPRFDPFVGLNIFVSNKACFRDCLDPEIRWPDYNADEPSRQQYVDHLKRELPRYGPQLKSLFVATFDTLGRLQTPQLRTLAEKWSNELEIASRWLFECDCGEQLVSNGVRSCPFCYAVLPHAKVKVGPKIWVVDREAFSLVGRDFNFHDNNDGRYEVMRFRRDMAKLDVELVKGGRTQILGKGALTLDIISQDGRARTAAEIIAR